MGGGASVPEELDLEQISTLAKLHGFDEASITAHFEQQSVNGKISKEQFNHVFEELVEQQANNASTEASTGNNAQLDKAIITSPAITDKTMTFTAPKSPAMERQAAKPSKARSFSERRSRRKRAPMKGLKLNSCSSSANFNISKVLPHLYLGASDASGLLPTLHALRVQRIVNCSEKLPNHHTNEIEYLRVPLPDEPSAPLEQFFETAANFIHAAALHAPFTPGESTASADSTDSTNSVSPGASTSAAKSDQDLDKEAKADGGDSKIDTLDASTSSQAEPEPAQPKLHMQGADAEKEKPSACFVHCSAGMSRSATIVIAYLIKHQDMSLLQALHLCKEARPVVAPNQGFMEQLVRYETKVRGKATVDLEKYIKHGRFGNAGDFASDGATVVRGRANSEEEGSDDVSR